MDIVVKYNGVTITPTPLVQQSYQFIDYGARWGQVLQLQLDGQLTGLTSTGSITGLVNIFSGQFGTLDVLEGSTSIYSWDNLHVEEITIPENKYFTNSFAPYSVKLHRSQVPSGVIEPVNEYSFSQGEDSVVTVNHRVGAKGVQNITGSFTNAVNFVRSLTGRNPFNPFFIPTGQRVLMSIGENINRVEGSYMVNELYRYNTGSANNYLEWFTVNSSNDFDNTYVTLETNLKIQGSPVNNNLGNIESSAISSFNVFNRLSAMGFVTGSLMRNNISVSRDSGAAIIEVKNSFLSGYNPSDISGFFDYNVTLDYDYLTPKEVWRLEGDFYCLGPLDYRLTRLALFKSTNSANWRNYFSGLLVASDLYTGYHDTTTFTHSTVGISENTGLATFHGTFSFGDNNSAHGNTPNAKYTVEISPSKWTFDSLPSANIEGHYVIQDLQMKTQGNLTFNVSCDTTNPVVAFPIISGYLTRLENIHLNHAMSGNVISENISTGLFDVSYNKTWLGFDAISSGALNTKVVGSTLANYTRKAGFKFGY